jgi:hypothetical protein
MTIDEAKKAQESLDRLLESAVRVFEKETGLLVIDINLNRLHVGTPGKEKNWLSTIKTEVIL